MCGVVSVYLKDFCQPACAVPVLDSPAQRNGWRRPLGRVRICDPGLNARTMPGPPNGSVQGVAVSACTVVIDPLWPVFIACSMSYAEWSRTSPMMMRSGRCRSAAVTRWATEMGGLPGNSSMASQRAAFWWEICNSIGFSITIKRSEAGIWAAKAQSSVDLPEPVPPLISTFRRFKTASTIKSLTCDGIDPHVNQFVGRKPAAKLADGHRSAVRTAGRVHGANTRAIW